MHVTRAVIVATLVAPATAFAQAWVPPAGDGTVAIVYQNQLVRSHLLDDGSRLNAGHINSNSLLLDFAYGVTDKFAINVNVPYIASAYHGGYPHQGSRLDDGRTRGTFQDFRINLRYKTANRDVVLTPFVDLIVPSHRYDYYGHAAPGRRLAEVQVGTYVGHTLTRGLPGVFIQGRLSYGFAQEPLDEYHDRSNGDAEVGYFINPRWRVFGLMATQYSFGGVSLWPGFAGLTAREKLHHDQISRTDLVDVGGGAQIQITTRTSLVASYATTVKGRNGHALAHSLSLGISWSFGRSFTFGDPLSDNGATKGLSKCLCQKGRSTP